MGYLVLGKEREFGVGTMEMRERYTADSNVNFMFTESWRIIRAG
jgi:hypothetical protein